jgi:hypothetical protein
MKSSDLGIHNALTISIQVMHLIRSAWSVKSLGRSARIQLPRLATSFAMGGLIAKEVTGAAIWHFHVIRSGLESLPNVSLEQGQGDFLWAKYT